MDKRQKLYVCHKAGSNKKYYIGEKKYLSEPHLWDFVQVVGQPKVEEDKGMTYDELKAALIELGIPFKGNAKKADLQALYDVESTRI